MFKRFRARRQKSKIDKIISNMRKAYISFRVELVMLNTILSKTRLNIHELEDVKSEKDNIISMLVEFGNYISSNERKNNLVRKENENRVTDSDIHNFIDAKEKECDCFVCKFKNVGIDVRMNEKGGMFMTDRQILEIIDRLRLEQEKRGQGIETASDIVENISHGARLIIDERLDQLRKGRDSKHDNEINESGKLISVASAILTKDYGYYEYSGWPKDWFEKTIRKDTISRLSIVGALIAAEIDRISSSIE